MGSKFDFIIVGAGPAGSVIAARVARSLPKQSVLLLEAGGDNHQPAHSTEDERFEVAFKPDSPLNWGYKVHQYGREIDYSRGKGLGGSTAINFCGWTTGPSTDYDEWARLVGNEAFNWQAVQKHLRSLVSVDPAVPGNFRHVIRPSSDQQDGGPIHLSYGTEWSDSLHHIFSAVRECGLAINPDVNNGNVIGMGVASVCITDGQRITSSDAFLKDAPSNLTILTQSEVWKVLTENGKAVQVQTTDGRVFSANNEIVLCGGTINTPKLLQLSGIGPKHLLERFDIPVVHSLENVGSNLQDHCFSTTGIALRDTDSDAKKQSPSPMGWFRIPSLCQSAEFLSLPMPTQRHLKSGSIPAWELVTHIPLLESADLKDDESPLAAMAILMNPQSRGFVHIASKDPSVAPVIDPMFLQHSFDQIALVAAVKEMLQLFRAPSLAKRTVRRIGWPDDESNAGILVRAVSSRLFDVSLTVSRNTSNLLWEARGI